MKDIFNDPHYAAREMIVDVPDDDLGSVKLVNVVPHLSRTPGRISKAGGQPGVDTISVLKKYGGLEKSEIDDLDADGVIFCGTQN